MKERANALVQATDKHLRQISFIENVATAESFVAESIPKLCLRLVFFLVYLVHSPKSFG